MADGSKIEVVSLPIRFPDDTQREAIIGRTGSGKTQAGMWQLSMRSWGFDTPKEQQKVWIIFDTKGDTLINESGAVEIDMRGGVPKIPGLYVVRPLPQRDDADFVAFLWKCWARGDVGLYFDEGYMVPEKGGAFLALLTQGRSKNIPMIILSQRPVELSRFVWSEADFFQLFNLNHADDKKTVTNFIPVPRNYNLPSFYSYYFDVGTNQLTPFKPVPDRDVILQTFEDRRPRRAKKL